VLAALAPGKFCLLAFRLHGTTHGERRRHISVLAVILAKMRSLVSHQDPHQNLPWPSRMSDPQRRISSPIHIGAQTACLIVIHICQHHDPEDKKGMTTGIRKCEQSDFRMYQFRAAHDLPFSILEELGELKRPSGPPIRGPRPIEI
jgi:hypothetical protein